MNQTAIYFATLAVYWFIYSNFTLGLNLSFGMSGILDFAYITFMALGAYIGGVVALGPEQAGSGITYILGLNAPWPVGLLCGALASALLGVLIGFVAVRRLRSDYMAIVMVGMWTVAWDVTGNETKLFNGASGLSGIPQPFLGAFGTNPLTYVYLFMFISFGVAVISFFVARNIQESSFGLALRAIREDQDAAAAFGKNVLRYRLKAMALSCAMAGAAGALTAEFNQAMNPNAWAIVETIIIYCALLLGGRGNVWGAVFGALTVRIIIIEGSSKIPGLSSHPALFGAARNIILGALLCLVLYLRPQGLFPERVRKYGADLVPVPLGSRLRMVFGRRPVASGGAVSE